ncbi:MAG: hypothetical protein WD894_20430 [Pirellulales bacterium]
MNQPYDSLEAELGELRPCEVSPGLKWRVAECLAETQTIRPARPWSAALAGGLAAACLAAVLLGWRNDQGFEPGPIEIQPFAPVVANGDAKPTVQVYRRALARSSNALHALLDKHAARTLPPDSERAQIRAFMRSDELYASNGEL